MEKAQKKEIFKVPALSRPWEGPHRAPSGWGRLQAGLGVAWGGEGKTIIRQRCGRIEGCYPLM